MTWKLYSIFNTIRGYNSSVSWNFDDPSSRANNTSTSFIPTQFFSATGNYNVTAKVNATCGSFQINYPLQIVNCSTSCTGTIVSEDSCLSSGTTFQVVFNNTISSKVWNFVDPASGASNCSSALTPTHVFSRTGVFTILSIVTAAYVIDKLFSILPILYCDSSIQDCQLFVSKSFTPNADGINHQFYPVINCPIEAYEFTIFYRWAKSSTNHPIKVINGRDNIKVRTVLRGFMSIR